MSSKSLFLLVAVARQMYEPWKVEIVSVSEGSIKEYIFKYGLTNWTGRVLLSVTVEEHFKYNLENDPIWTWNIKLSTQFNEKFSQFLEKMSTEYFEERRAQTVKLLLVMFRKMKLYLIVRLRYWSKILGYTSKFFEVTDFVHQWASRFTKRKLDKRVTRG